MPRLSCWKCGRQIYTVAPLEALFAEERRCPRCGAFLRTDRRETERRTDHRRQNPQHDPGPPKPAPLSKPKPTAATKPKARTKAKPTEAGQADAADDERRVAERRTVRRRGSGASPPAAASSESSGSQD
jgi:hypothetical protein